MAWAQEAWTKFKAVYHSFMDVWESPLSVVGGLILGALASLFVVAKLDEQLRQGTCRFETVRAAFSSEQELDARQNWSDAACDGILGANYNNIPHYFRNIFKEENHANKENKLEYSLREKLQAARDAISKQLQFWKILIAAVALLWLYVFNIDAFRKIRKDGAAGLQGDKSAADKTSRPRPEYRARLSRNRWALFCYSFAASTCVYFTASTAGTAAANVITSNTYLGDNIRLGDNERSRETIRELHFAQFLDRNIDPRAYERLAWHFFFEEGALTAPTACKPEFTPTSFAFRDGLMTANIQNRIGEIITALAACAGEGMPVRLKVTGQASRRAFDGCKRESPQLNEALAKQRAEEIRRLFDEAMKAKPQNDGRVILEGGVLPYPFDFSDAGFHAADGQKIPPGQLPPSPYYLAQTAALVLEDPSQCVRDLKVPGPSPAE